MENWQEEILKQWQKADRKSAFITDEIRDRLAREFKGQALYREPMAKHTSIRIGGVADVFLKPESVDDIRSAVKIAREAEIPILLLGSGSNTLVKDGGIRGFVLKPASALQKYEVVQLEEEFGDVRAEAGVGITAFVNFTKDQSLSGMESFVGIPGSMGGAIAMNAGARGWEVKDLVREITVLDGDGEIKTIPREKLEFAYRSLKIPRAYVILSGLFRLQKANIDEIAQRIREYQKLRADTQPLNYPNLGSIFKNPVPQKKNEPPVYAAQLIEECGLKNIRVGGARVSEKHANFIVNEKEATAKDVTVLINLVRDKVKEKTGVVLEPEVKIVGEDL